MAIERTLLIEYDLSKPGQDYPGLIDFIKGFGTWCHHLKSAWMVRTSLTASEMRDKVKTFLDANDKVMVMDVTGDTAAWQGMSKEISDWILKNL